MYPVDRDVASIDIDLTLDPALPGQLIGSPEEIWMNAVLDIIL